LLLVTLLIGATMCFAADPNLGTWKLNEGKSKIAAGLPKNTTVTYDAAGDGIKAHVEGVEVKENPRTWSDGSTMAKTIRSQATSSSDTPVAQKITPYAGADRQEGTARLRLPPKKRSLSRPTEEKHR